jgi:peptidyl-prolyl cis-trans isomerase C
VAVKLHLFHILVEQKFEAEDLLKKIKEGVDFTSLAQKFSKCPSASQGGDLGLIDLSRLDSDFAEAALTLKQGEISGTVRTRFGYHLIRREGAPVKST